MSQPYKEPPKNFALKFCSMGCNDDSSQTEISGNQVGTLAMLPKQNENQVKKQQNLNDSQESDMLEGISEKGEETADKRDFIQPSLTQKNTLSSLKQGGSLLSTNRSPFKQGSEALKLQTNKSDLFKKEINGPLHSQDQTYLNESKPIARVLGYGGSENAISDDEEMQQQYQFQNGNIIPSYQQRAESEKRSGVIENIQGNKHYPFANQSIINNSNNNIQFQGTQDYQQQDNLESTERFNAQFGSNNSNMYQNQRDLQQKFAQFVDPQKNGEDNQFTSPRFTEETTVQNNAAMQQILQQKILQDRLLISQLKSSNFNNNYGANSPPAQFQSIQNQIGSNSHRLNPDSNSHRQMQEFQQNHGQTIQDQYAQMMNGVCLTKGSLPSNNDQNAFDQHYNLSEIPDSRQSNQQLQQIRSLMDQETFFPSNNQFNSNYNSSNPNNYEINHPHNIQTNNLNQVIQQKQNNNQINGINSANSFGGNEMPFNPNQYQQVEQQQDHQPHQQKQQQQQQKLLENIPDVYSSNKIIQYHPQGIQQYQIPKGYEVINGNSYPIDKMSYFSDTQQVKQVSGDRPITVESSRGTEYSQKNISSARGMNQQNRNSSIPNVKSIKSEPINNNNSNPLNVYLMQNSPIINQTQVSNRREQDQSEDIRCNYSQSINEIQPIDQEQQQKHYLHQHLQKKKRDLVSDSHLFNSFNNTNFFQNQTIPNNSNYLQNSNLNLSNAPQGNGYQQKNQQNRIVNLSSNSEVHEYSKSKTPINEPGVNQSSNNFTSQLQNGSTPMNQSLQAQNQNDGDRIPRDSMNSSQTNQGNSINQGNVDMSTIIQKVNDMQGKQKDQQINQVMLNSLNTQTNIMPSVNNFNSINQYASSNPNQTGNFDTARTISQVYLNSLHFHDAAGSNIQFNQMNTLTSSIDGRKKSESIFTPKNQKNGIISSNPNLQTQYTFKQLDTPDASVRDQLSTQQHQFYIMNSNQLPIKETDRALEQSDLEGNLTNQHYFGYSPPIQNHQERELQQMNQMIPQNLRKDSEEGYIPDDEYKHPIHETNIDIDPVYKLSPKAKSQSSLSNNQIYNENVQRNLINSLQYMSNQSSQQGQIQSYQQFQYQSNGQPNFYKDNQYSSQNSSSQASPFNKLSLHLDKIEQISSPVVVDPSPKYTDPNSLSQFSPHGKNREEQVKQSMNQRKQSLNESDQQQYLEELDRQKIEAALMNNDDETEDNKKLIKYIYESGLMKNHLPPIPQENSSNCQGFSPEKSNNDIELEEQDQIDPHLNQNTLQSNGYHQNAQYINGKFSNQIQAASLKPSIQYENTPNFNSSIGSNSNNTIQNKNQNYPVMNTLSSQNSMQKDQSPIALLNHTRQVSIPTTHDNHPFNYQQNDQQLPPNNINSLNKYFINSDYSIENPKLNQYSGSISNPMKNVSQASSIRVNKGQPLKLTDNSRNQYEWSQNNDGTIMFTRDGVDYLPQESINENILFLNSSKALRDKNSPSPSRLIENTFTQNQLFEPIVTHDNRPIELNIENHSPGKERKSRSPSPLTIKMTKASELKQKASQEKIKQMNEKVQKKKDLINQREQEFQKRQEEKEVKQENVIKEQNKQLRLQNIRLKEQNELLKKQMDVVFSTNQNVMSIQSGASAQSQGQMPKLQETVNSARQNSTPHKKQYKTNQQNTQFSTKMRSPSMNALHNNQSHGSLNHSINKNNNSNNIQSPVAYPVVQIQMNLSHNPSNQNLAPYYKTSDHLQQNNQQNQQQKQNNRGNSPNSNMCQIDISNVLNLAKQQSPDIQSKDHFSVGSQSNPRSNNPSRKTSISDVLSQDHPKLNYSPKNVNSVNDHAHYASINSHRSQNLNNYHMEGSQLSNNPSVKSLNQNRNQMASEQGSPSSNYNKFISQSSKNLHQIGHQVNSSFQRVPYQNKLMESTGNNSISDTIQVINTKDTFQQSSPENQLKGTNNHQRSLSSIAFNPTKSSITSKPQNQLYDSKNSAGYENLQIQMSDQFIQKPSLNDISVKSPDDLNKKLDFSSNKKASNNMNNSTKESFSGQLTSNQSRIPQSDASPINSKKNDKQILNNNQSEFLMSAHLDNKNKSSSGNNKSNKPYGIRDKVDQEMNKVELNNKYKLVQNIDNTYLLMQRNTKPQQKNSIHELSKNSYKNNFMPRQYNPDDFKNKNQQNSISQENSYDQIHQSNQKDIKNSQQKNDDSKAPLKLVLVPNQQQQNNLNQLKQSVESHRSKQGDINQKNILEKKHSTPSLTLPKTNSNLSIGLKSNRSNVPINLGDSQNISQISIGQSTGKNGQINVDNQINKPSSQTHMRSQSNIIQSQTPNSVQSNSVPQTNPIINNAMNSIFQKIENSYGSISAGYDKSVNLLKKENK